MLQRHSPLAALLPGLTLVVVSLALGGCASYHNLGSGTIASGDELRIRERAGGQGKTGTLVQPEKDEVLCILASEDRERRCIPYEDIATTEVYRECTSCLYIYIGLGVALGAGAGVGYGLAGHPPLPDVGSLPEALEYSIFTTLIGGIAGLVTGWGRGQWEQIAMPPRFEGEDEL